MSKTVIENGRIVTPDHVLTRGDVVIDDGTISYVGPETTDDKFENKIDAEDRWVLPGIVDLHGDDLERHFAPRSEAEIDMETALLTCDRENIAAGVTTKFHALAFEYAPEKNRSVETCREAVATLESMDSLLCDARVHARCEISDSQAVRSVREIASNPLLEMISIMRHVPGEGQFDGLDEFKTRYSDGGQADRAAVDGLIEHRRSTDTDDCVSRIEHVLEIAHNRGISTASHDNETIESIEAMYEAGVDICEYPVTLEAAARAADLGMTTAMGAPNLVRGKSLWGNLNASEAIEEDVLDILCSDFHPYSLLNSVFVRTGEALPNRVNRVTAAPAAAVGLHDRGKLRPDNRGDIIIVDGPPQPSVTTAIVDGHEVFNAGLSA